MKSRVLYSKQIVPPHASVTSGVGFVLYISRERKVRLEESEIVSRSIQVCVLVCLLRAFVILHDLITWIV